MRTTLPDATPLDLLRAMMTIRAFEEALMARPDHGFQLLSSGEEAVAVGVCAVLERGDQLLCSGRSIGPALARGLAPSRVMAELTSNSSGTNDGIAGRGHLAQPEAGFFGAHPVVGGNLGIAAGVALAAQVTGSGTIAVCIFGDGACGAGALGEALNVAAIWKLPLVFVCDDNGYSIATPRSYALAPAALSDLATPFGIPAVTVDGMDVLAVRDAAAECAKRARSGGGPSFLECRSERFSSHSTSTPETRTPQELAAIRARCPIETLRARLTDAGLLTETGWRALQADVARTIADV